MKKHLLRLSLVLATAAHMVHAHQDWDDPNDEQQTEVAVARKLIQSQRGSGVSAFSNRSRGMGLVSAPSIFRVATRKFQNQFRSRGAITPTIDRIDFRTSTGFPWSGLSPRDSQRIILIRTGTLAPITIFHPGVSPGATLTTARNPTRLANLTDTQIGQHVQWNNPMDVAGAWETAMNTPGHQLLDVVFQNGASRNGLLGLAYRERVSQNNTSINTFLNQLQNGTSTGTPQFTMTQDEGFRTLSQWQHNFRSGATSEEQTQGLRSLVAYSQSLTATQQSAILGRLGSGTLSPEMANLRDVLNASQGRTASNPQISTLLAERNAHNTSIYNDLQRAYPVSSNGRLDFNPNANDSHVRVLNTYYQQNPHFPGVRTSPSVASFLASNNQIQAAQLAFQSMSSRNEDGTRQMIFTSRGSDGTNRLFVFNFTHDQLTQSNLQNSMARALQIVRNNGDESATGPGEGNVELAYGDDLNATPDLQELRRLAPQFNFSPTTNGFTRHTPAPVASTTTPGETGS